MALNGHSLQFRRPRDGPSHQADLEGPEAEREKISHHTQHNVPRGPLSELLLTIGPGAPFSPAEPVSP